MNDQLRALCAVVGAGHVAACVLLLVLFFSTGSWVFFGLATVAGIFGGLLLRDE